MRSALIVDDERLARRELRLMLERTHAGAVRVVGEAATVARAAELARLTGPEVIFLDVQLTGESGLDLLPHLDAEVEVVFVTAFDEYAVRAFEVNALDYLLKPVAPERLARTVARLAAAPGEPDVEPARGPLNPGDRVFVRTGARMEFLTVDDIVAIAADGDHALVRTANGATARVRRPIREWAARLPARAFARVHRSTIVNLAYVARVEPWSHSSFRIHLRGVAEPVLMSRRYAARMRHELR